MGKDRTPAAEADADLREGLRTCREQLELLSDRYLHGFHFTPFNVRRCRLFCKQMQELSQPEAYRQLLRGLDEESIACVAASLSAVQRVASELDPEQGGVLDIYDTEQLRTFDRIHKQFYNQIIQLSKDCWAWQEWLLPVRAFTPEIFYYRLMLPQLDCASFASRDIIDAGAFIGDSAVVLSQYTTASVLAFEPLAEHCQLMQRSITLNGRRNIVPVQLGLGESCGSAWITADAASSTLSAAMPLHGADSRLEHVTVTTLDEYTREHPDLDIGLIKIDVEGLEQPLLRGARQCIARFRPLLLISIYHQAGDFFAIKPMLESWDLGYTFKIRRANPANLINEIMLIAEFG